MARKKAKKTWEIKTVTAGKANKTVEVLVNGSHDVRLERCLIALACYLDVDYAYGDAGVWSFLFPTSKKAREFATTVTGTVRETA